MGNSRPGALTPASLRKGGLARMKSLTAKERSQLARKAVTERWRRWRLRQKKVAA